MTALRTRHLYRWAAVLIPTLLLALAAYAGNDVLGEIQFEGNTRIDKTSGVWVDGEYVGYLNELRGSKKVMLLPGNHEIVVRQNGYKDYREQVRVQPGLKMVVHVNMQQAPTGAFSDTPATIKIDVNPSRAAVFLDGAFVGHVGEFRGPGRGMLIVPGKHQIRIALPGYETFETDINPQANQAVVIKTDLVKDGAPLAAPLVKTEG